MEVGRLDARSLLKLCELLNVGRFREKRRALSSVFVGNVPRDSPTFVDLEAVVIDDVRDLTEGLVFEESRGFMLLACEVDRDELVRDVVLLENACDSASAGKEVNTVETKNHVE